MHFIKTEIEGVYIVEPRVFEDERGYFFESYSHAKFEGAGLHYDFIQDNQSENILFVGKVTVKTCFGVIKCFPGFNI